VAKVPHFVGDADLAEGRLLQRKFNDPRRDPGGAVQFANIGFLRLISCTSSLNRRGHLSNHVPSAAAGF